MTPSCLLTGRASVFALAVATVGLALLSSFSALAGIYVAVLDDPATEFDHVQIINPDGIFGIPAAGYGTYVDRGFITVQRTGEAEMESRFGAALQVMNALLASGLPTLQHSYAALLEHREGPLGSLHVLAHARPNILQEPGQAVLIDGYSNEPFKVDAGQIEADFGMALTALAETRKAGAPPSSYVMLLEDPDGAVGKVSVTDVRGSLVIDKAGQAVDLSIHTAPLETFQADATQSKDDFAAAMSARPPLPVKLVVFFKSGSAQLTEESQQALRKLADDLRSRPSPDIVVEGHTDTVGSVALNNKLSHARAMFVANRIGALGVPARQMEIQAFGESKPLVPTADNTKEEKNRRVEVRIW